MAISRTSLVLDGHVIHFLIKHHYYNKISMLETCIYGCSCTDIHVSSKHCYIYYNKTIISILQKMYMIPVIAIRQSLSIKCVINNAIHGPVDGILNPAIKSRQSRIVVNRECYL